MRVQAKQHQYCSKCGKRFVFRDTAIKRIDADGLLEWAERNYDLCPECYKAEAMKLAIKRADEYGLPKVSGVSQKQTALAIMLRDRFVTKHIDLFRYLQKAIVSFGPTVILPRIKGDTTMEAMRSVFMETNSGALISVLQ